MRKPHEEKFDPTQPTLIVKYGTTKRKYRPLLREVVVLGRGSGCDIGKTVDPQILWGVNDDGVHEGLR